METKQKLYEKIWKDLIAKSYKHSSRSSYESAWKIMKATRLHYMTLLSPWNFITVASRIMGFSSNKKAQVLFVIEAAADGLYSFPSFLSMKRLDHTNWSTLSNPLGPSIAFWVFSALPSDTAANASVGEHPATAHWPHGLVGWPREAEHPSNRRWFMTR